MLAAIRSAAVLGIEAYDVTVEVNVTKGLPQWTVVGLAHGAVKEARERVSAAVVNSGFEVPPRRVTVNLAPADQRKEGTAFDLPIALALLVATGQLAADAVRDLVVIGELGLDGALRPVRGVLPVARALAAPATPRAELQGRLVREAGARTLLVPPANVGEARLCAATRVATAASLEALVAALVCGPLAEAPAAPPDEPAAAEAMPDFADVAGQPAAKRALVLAAAGGHNVLLIGAPGAGKTMLARRLPTILPPLDESERLEVVAVHSVAGMLTPQRARGAEPPFRAPHHTTSTAGLIGGGSVPRPGEVSLAHRGVLFLDELLEFPRHVLDALRQPLEDGHVTLARAAASLRFPARFTLVAATNPCPCGRAGVTRTASDAAGVAAAGCSCARADVARYRARLSGPLADRLDLHVPVAPVPLALLGASLEPDGGGSAGLAGPATSDALRAAVVAARARQRERYAALPGVLSNAEAPGRWLDRHGLVTGESRALLVRAAERLNVSARAYHRVLRVARTVADLAGEAAVAPEHVAEALRYRPASP